MSLQLAPEQVKKIAVAKDLGKLSLAMRAAVDTRRRARSPAAMCRSKSPNRAQSPARAQPWSFIQAQQGQAILGQERRRGGGALRSTAICRRDVVPDTTAVVRLDGGKVKENSDERQHRSRQSARR